MSAKKAADPARPSIRVVRAFTHEGRYITHARQLKDVPRAVLEDRIRRGYIVGRLMAPAPAPAAKAKE